MCLFFFISGFLFKQKGKLKTFIAKKTKNILIPFVIWDLLASLVAIALSEDIKSTIARFFVINGALCWNAPIWFLLILFITETIYAVFMKMNNTKIMTVLLLLSSLILWIILENYNFTLKLNLVPFALFFYTLGNITHQGIEGKTVPRTTILFIIFIAGVCSIVFGAILNIRISYTGATFGNVYYCVIAAVAGTIFYFLLFKNTIIGNNKILAMLGKNSLIIMASQYWFFRAYDLVSQKLWNLSVWHGRSTIKAIIVTFITIFFIMIIVSTFKKIFKDNDKILNAAKYIGIR